MLRVVHDRNERVDATPAEASHDERMVDLDELCRLAARDMIAVALEGERRAYLASGSSQAAKPLDKAVKPMPAMAAWRLAHSWPLTHTFAGYGK